MENKIRVFISYSHKDRALVQELLPVLAKCNVDVIWDENLIAGYGFHDQIKDSIANAHVFMPIITKESSERGWVHQEIGYAMALNIPVLPVTTENLDPSGMLQMVHAVKINDEVKDPGQLLNRFTFEKLLSSPGNAPIFMCAHLPEERTRMIIEYANKISGMNRFGVVRQKGGLSSFHIPNDCIIRSVWEKRYHPDGKGEYHKRLQRKERLALEKHATEKGYKIIISPDYATDKRSKISAAARVSTLIAFLQANKHETSIVAIQSKKTPTQSLTIVGDWFLAESVSFKPNDGFTNTFFTRDAAEIARRTEDFDCELTDILQQKGWTEKTSREKAIEYLKAILEDIKMRKE
jgi:hypothetical protein